MNNPDIMVLDTEHGGFVKNATLLEAYFGIFNDAGQLVNELHLFLKPDDGAYIVNAEAMAVNKINLVEHDKIAITYSEGSKLLRQFLYENSDGGKQRLEPLGHNVAGDIEMIKDRLLGGSNSKWTQYVNYRQLDTATIFAYLKRKGKVPFDMSGALGKLSSYFQVEVLADHTAKADSHATYQVYKKLEEL